MLGLIVPISSPSRTSIRESAATDERAKPPARSTINPAPTTAAPPRNSRLFISTLLCATSVSSVSLWLTVLREKHHRDTEDTELAQRKRIQKRTLLNLLTTSRSSS